MRRLRRDLDAFLDAVARGDRRPPRFPAGDDEAREMRAAAALRAGRPGADAPHPEFVEKLEQTLRERVREQDAGRRVAEEPLVTRRRLLGGAAAAVAAAAVGAGIDRAIDRGNEHGRPASRQLVPDSGRWVDVAAVEEVPVGRPLRFSAGAMEGFLVNHGDHLSAVSAICTHMPCVLDFNASAQQLDCPCHPARFGLDGQPIVSHYDHPAALPSLPSMRTRVVDGRVQVFTA